MKINEKGLVRVWRTDRKKWEEVDPAKAETLFGLELAREDKPAAKKKVRRKKEEVRDGEENA